MPKSPIRVRSAARLAAAVALAGALASCASLTIERETETSGTFRSTARTFTVLGWDIPRRATHVAHENIADASLPNVRSTKVRATDWGWFEWILEILSTRSASIEGTWGYSGDEAGIGEG